MYIHAFIIFLSLLVSESVFSQSGKSRFYTDGYGMLYSRKHIFFVSINTENNTDVFFKELTRRYGSPIVAGEYTIFKCVNKKWAEEKVVIRISNAIQTDLDGKKSNILFIFVETKDHVDLLNPKRRSSNKIKTYFNNLFLDKIVPGSLDSFDNP